MIDCLVFESRLGAFCDAPLHNCSLDRLCVQQESEHLFENRLGPHLKIFIAQEVRRDLIGNIDYCFVVLLHAFYYHSDKVVPELGEGLVPLLVDCQAMTTGML